MIVTETTDLELVWLAVEHLHPAEDNPRHELGDLDELAASIVSVGVLQPLVVVERIVGGGYTIVAGHRRHAAARIAGAETVPCVVRTMNLAERQTAMLVENLHRRDLDPLDEATGFQHLADLGHSQREIAELVGCNQSHVSRRLALTKLPDKAVQLVRAGTIQLRTAEQLADVADADIDDVFATALKKGDWRLKEGGELPDWTIEQAVNELARKRKHAAAIEVGKASKLKRLKDDPRYGYSSGGFEKCKKSEATHWYCGGGDQSVTWARVKSTNQAGTEKPKNEWEIRRDRDGAVEAERDQLLVRLMQADRSAVIATGMKVLADRLRNGEHVGLGVGGLRCVLDVDEVDGPIDPAAVPDDVLIGATVLSTFARPGYNGDTELQTTVWAGLASRVTADDVGPDAAGIALDTQTSAPEATVIPADAVDVNGDEHPHAGCTIVDGRCVEPDADDPEPPAADVVQEPEAPQVDEPADPDDFSLLDEPAPGPYDPDLDTDPMHSVDHYNGDSVPPGPAPKRPWATYDGNDVARINQMATSMTVVSGVQAILDYELANGGRAAIVEHCRRRLAELGA